MLWLFACAVEVPRDDTESVLPDDTDSPSVATGLVVPPHLALPYALEGEPAPSAVLTLLGDTRGDLEIGVSGPFTVDGDATPVDGERELVVALAGGTGRQRASGLLTVDADGASYAVTLAAVIGRDLPQAVWEDTGMGLRTLVELPSAPFPDGNASVVVFLPTGARGPLGVVTHLHGHNALLPGTVDSQYLTEQHGLSGRNAVLIVPQGPVQQPSGDFGQLMEPGGWSDLVDDVVSLLYRDGLDDHADIAGTVLTAHSGGYLAVSRLLTNEDLPVDAVHLFDALYGAEDVFREFAIGGGRLLSSHTTYGGTVDENDALADEIEASGIAVGTSFSDADLRAFDVVVGPVDASHGEAPWDERAFARWLATSPLAASPTAPPELLYATADEVRWVLDGREVVAVRDGGSAWAAVEGGEPSDVYAASGSDWLIVDGFDRVLDGSWHESTHDFAARIGAGLSSASTASNEAVAEGLVDLADYGQVLWMLGDEGVRDRTFDAAERNLVEDYLASGGRLLVTGAELGWATDREWLGDVLGVGYVADDAGTDEAGGYRFGVVYDEDYPDVLSGDETVWTYATGGAAAVRSGPVIAVGFGLENLAVADVTAAVDELTTAW